MTISLITPTLVAGLGPGVATATLSSAAAVIAGPSSGSRPEPPLLSSVSFHFPGLRSSKELRGSPLGEAAHQQVGTKGAGGVGLSVRRIINPLA